MAARDKGLCSGDTRCAHSMVEEDIINSGEYSHPTRSKINVWDKVGTAHPPHLFDENLWGHDIFVPNPLPLKALDQLSHSWINVTEWECEPISGTNF